MARSSTRKVWDRYWKKQWESQKERERKELRKNMNGEIFPVNGFYSRRLQTEEQKGIDTMADLKIYECYDENNEKTLTLEVWGSSTKYPDSKFYFCDFEKTEWVDEEHQVFQWLLECASKMTFPNTAKQIAELALKDYVTWEKKEG